MNLKEYRRFLFLQEGKKNFLAKEHGQQILSQQRFHFKQSRNQ